MVCVCERGRGKREEMRERREKRTLKGKQWLALGKENGFLNKRKNGQMGVGLWPLPHPRDESE